MRNIPKKKQAICLSQKEDAEKSEDNEGLLQINDNDVE